MAFSQSTILQVYPPQIRGAQVYLCWETTSPLGTNWQVYINRQLAWTGQRLWTWLPIPSGPIRIDIGTVDADEAYANFADALPSAPTRRAQLTWQSGTYKGIDLAGFRLYGVNEPGGPIDYSTVVADITAYPAGIITDGFGFGKFGGGGFGQTAGTYTWTSKPLTSGAWQFAVVPYDQAGNEGVAQTTTVVINAVPGEPTAFSNSTTRLQYGLNGFGQVGFGANGFGLTTSLLTWNPSP